MADRLLVAVTRALIVGTLLIAGLLAAIAARGAYGPETAVAVLWPCWSAVLIGLSVRVLLVEPDHSRKARR